MSLLADRYLLAEPLGSGGMADVVTAHDQRLGRDVAIKLIRPELLADPNSRARLLREARAAAALHHPHAVTVHDVHDDGERPFIVMELVEGGSLADRLREDGALEPEETLAIGVSLLEALGAAHAAGLVHRDVKPSNILFTRDGRVKLADFGIAKALAGTDPDLTATGQIPGTPRYLAPELAAGADASPASDLYAVGAVLYQCVTGQPPFVGPTPMSVVLAHQRDPVPSLQDVAPGVPASLAATIQRALQKTPEARFGNAEQMRDALLGELDLSGTVPLPADDPHHPGHGAGREGPGSGPTVGSPPPPATGAFAAPLAASSGSPQGGEAATSTLLHGTDLAGSGDGSMAPGDDAPGAAYGATTVDGGASGATGEATTVDGGASGATGEDSTTTEGPPRWQRQAGIALAVLLVGALLVAMFAFLGGGSADPEQAAEGEAPSADGSEATDADGDGPADTEPAPAEPVDDEDPAAGDEEPATDEDEPVAADEPAEPEPEPEPEPLSLDELIAELARDPEAAGRDGDRLLDGLVELRRTDEDKQAEEARKLMKEIASWLDRDRLERAVGVGALETLEAFSRPAAPELAEASGLLVDVASERGEWGKKGKDVLDDLVDLLQADNPEDWSEDAADLIEEIDTWIDKDELDAARGQRAREILARLV